MREETESAYESTEPLRVEITVRCGGDFGVQLSAIVKVKNLFSDPPKARHKLMGAVSTLLKSIPLSEVRDAETQYAEKRAPVVQSDGTPVSLSQEDADAIKGQQELKKKLGNGGASK